MHDARKLMEAAQNNLRQSNMNNAQIATVYALCAIAAGLDEIARSLDLAEISDGVKQTAVELGGIGVAIGNQ